MTLREIRENKGCSVQKFATMLGVSRQIVYQWEKAETFPSLSRLPLLEEVYGQNFIDGVRGTLKEQGKWNKM